METEELLQQVLNALDGGDGDESLAVLAYAYCAIGLRMGYPTKMLMVNIEHTLKMMSSSDGKTIQ